MTVTEIAKACHEINRALCLSLGDDSQFEWTRAPEWQVQSAIAGVEAIQSGDVTRADQSHVAWAREKRSQGWVYGAKKDADLKTHPCIVPHHELPPEQQLKDELFFSTVIFLSEMPS